ncbi:hypothetical protein LTR91_002292 [Friedmanniomyces endolithicus]|uniref:Uncharacterized protein n=1 Tax=Friedmanniomyces endolithicus TaxID=329885 RepID=A0AAN6R0Y8_9PEZI|nr:hypothetical protein LTR35_015165 [Friedmanniomyces endolithicus]KAK0277708.1 hypothetical protein LTS00_014059 [Friedmanniomyces endolithicus]KAK0314406.1 hypothetical protein LTR01_001229 [Friedmanniomyces endolithicus]KAK0318286.1 hypothetical protein LTR82_010674 [Friedmanniomyces endolithicus]KAK0827794.1 hypothetical protein LTR73_005396 [Friedmanniomyces endolithicus]
MKAGATHPLGTLSSYEPLDPASTVSRLESLLAELRNAIYELVLVPPGGVTLARRPHTDRLWMVRPRRGDHLVALTATSKLLRREALPLFYGLNVFTLTSTPGPCFNGPVNERARKDIVLLNDWVQAVSYSIDECTPMLSLVVHTPAWHALFADLKTRTSFQLWRLGLTEYTNNCLGAEHNGGIVKSLRLADISKDT